MTGRELAQWRKNMGLSKSAAAQKLGLSWNGYAAYEQRKEIPAYLAWACAAIAYDLPPWRQIPQ